MIRQFFSEKKYFPPQYVILCA